MPKPPDGFDQGLDAPGAALAERLFCAIARARAAAFERGWLRSHRLDAQVISVGNLVAGGAGKTPLVIALAQALHAQGRHVAVLHRGYRAQAERGLYSIAPGSGEDSDPAIFGDEAVLVARRVPQVAVLSGSDRAALGQRAIEQFSADTLLVDDGFQHRRLQRDLDLVVLRAPQWIGNGYCLPRGPLREPLAGLQRASVLIFHQPSGADKNDLDDPQDPTQHPWHDWAPLRSHPLREILLSKPWLRVHSNAASLVPLDKNAAPLSLDSLRGQRVLAACAIARPQGFLADLTRLGALLVDTHIQADHAPWSRQILAQLERRAHALGALIITTEKDAVKWINPPIQAMALRQDLRFDSDRFADLDWLRVSGQRTVALT